VSPAGAVTTAAGPYYADPSWDQQLPAATRFVVLSNWGSAAVLDRETGLVWERSPDATQQIWDIAQIICGQKNVGGREGWKLPSIQELGSLADTTQSNPALPAGHPFTNVQSSGYWSATTSALSSDDAWDIEFFGGGISRITKSSTLRAWCVRGGPGGDVQ
jgi:hypothetical protein